ncbi:MAG: prenyltransferase/squalene oxidase repeat-containing protein, partial [Planctomycetia bacterium]
HDVLRSVLNLTDAARRGTHCCDAAADAAGRTAAWLFDRQAIDGHWRAPLEGDTILESEYLLLLAWAGRTADPHAPGACRRILAEQLPGGGWAIHPGGPVDVSASVKAYLALKIFGHDAASEPLTRARAAIAAAGGPWAVNSFTKFYLALLGQIPYSECPAVPSEMVLLPRWFPVNLDRVSAWSRTMIVPLSLMWTFKPVRLVPHDRGMAELFVGAVRPRPQSRDGWAVFFRGVDRVLKACEAVGLRPLRSRAVMACRRWMLERFDGSDGLGAIFPPIVWSIVALRALGCDDDSPEVRECWRQLERLVEPQSDGTTRLEPCRSPVWDTAITVRALAAVAGEAGENAAVDAARVAEAVDWLLDREVRSAGDWTQSASKAAPSGWCFQYANRFYPDVDDTAMVLIALATWREAFGDAAAQTPAGRVRLQRIAAAVDRATAWLEAMQNAESGRDALYREHTRELLSRVP